MPHDRTYDPFSPEILADPYPWYAWLRETSPAYHVPDTDIWVVTRARDVEATLRNHAVFSSTGGVGPEWIKRPMMSMCDPPEHSRLRRLVAPHFTPKYVASLAPGADARTVRLLDQLLVTGGGDFVGDFAEPFAAALMADLLGIPTERQAEFRRWSHAIVLGLATGAPPSLAREAETNRVEFVTYLRSLVAQRSAKEGVGTDIISLLVAANVDDALTTSEVIAFCVMLLVAGFETTVNGFTNLIHALILHDEAREAVWSDPKLVGGAIEEGLRYDAPDQAFFRNTLRDVQVDSVMIPEHSKVMVAFGSANRDPARFPDPDTFDVRRNEVSHLAFGAGIHYCIGAPLARMQLDSAVRALAARTRAIKLAGEPVRTANVIVRGFRSLPVTLVPR